MSTTRTPNRTYSRGWTFERVAQNIWKIFRTTAPHSITMTGAAVTTQLNVPFAHRWLRMSWYHTDNAYAASVANLSVTMQRTADTIVPANFEENLFEDAAIVAATATETFGEKFEYERTLYDLILDSTNAHLIFPVFYIQKLEA